MDAFTQNAALVWLVAALLAHTGGVVQRFETEPVDTEVNHGQTVILQCIVANIQGDVQWTQDGFAFGHDLSRWPRYEFWGSASRGERSLMISNAQLKDDALYECQVTATSQHPGIRTGPAKLTVRFPCQPPVVESSRPIPDSIRRIVEVVADTPSNLTCTAPQGRPAANVTWWKDGELAEGDTYTVVTGSGKRLDSTVSLNITAKRFEKLRYECRAINAAMTTAKTVVVELDVLYAPVVSINVSPTGEVREDQAVSFTCSASANPSNDIKWKWFVDGVEVAGVNRATYHMDRVKREHHGKKVACEATNKVGTTTSEHMLSVRYSPRFIEPPKHAEIDLGDDAVLTCEVDSNPSAYIVWRRRDDPKNTIISRDKQLVVTQVSPRELGVYTCSATIPDFDGIQAEIHILKNGPPKVTSSPSQSARFGSGGVVECRIDAVPVTKVVWSRYDKELDLTTLDRYDQTEKKYPGGVVSQLQIASVQDSDYGDFNCSMDNNYGSDVLTITLHKQAVIPVAYILACLLVGVVLIIIVSIAIFVYHRRKKSSLGGEGSSDSSADSTTKKPVGDLTASPYKPYVDTWRPEIDQHFYRQSADYDELTYPARDGRRSANPYDMDYPDSYGNYGYERDHRRDYGTYPGPAGNAGRPYNPRHEPISPYGPTVITTPAEYGTYGRAPSRQSYTAGPPRGPPDSRLSTNV